MKLDFLRSDGFSQLSFNECGQERCLPNKVFKFTAKKYHLFHYVFSGKGYLEINGKKYELGKGMLFYIPPKVSPKYYPDSNNPWAYAWLGFNGSIADDFLKCCNLSIDNPIFVDNKLQLRQLFSTLVEEHKKTNQCDLNCLGITYQIVHKMVSMKNENPSFTIKEKHVFEAQEFIKNNYQFDITIKDIASSCAITTNYLSNIFNEVCGLTTKQYLINIRLEKAATLLQEKKTKIKEISKLVGYKNQLHFSSEFKKRFGISPKQYINKCYKKED